MSKESQYKVSFKTQWWENNERKIESEIFHAYNSDHARDLCISKYNLMTNDIIDVEYIY